MASKLKTFLVGVKVTLQSDNSEEITKNHAIEIVNAAMETCGIIVQEDYTGLFLVNDTVLGAQEVDIT